MAYIPNTISSPVLGIVRYVYLVQDASDQVKLGGTANNTYTTWQSTYDAANTLQVLLGGSNSVVIIVGNTTAATVGNLILSANWNINISVIGQSSVESIVGTITATTFTLAATFSNITVGNVSSTSASISLTSKNSTIGTITTTGGNITITSINSTVGILTTSSSTGASGTITLTANSSTIGNIVTTSTGGASGAASIANSYSSTIGSITMNSSLGNIGNLTYTNCNNISTGAITSNQTSTTTSFNVGPFSLAGCNNCIFSTYTSSMAFAASTGNIGGWSIGNTNQGILFTGNVTIFAFTNLTLTASDVPIVNFIINNVTFDGSVGLNNLVTGSANMTGGVINNFVVNNCTFNGIKNRFTWNAVTNALTNGVIALKDCKFTSTSGSSGAYFTIINSTFTAMNIERCVAMDSAIGIAVDSSNSTFTMLSGNPLVMDDISGDGAAMVNIFQSGALLTFDDVQMRNISTSIMSFTITSGDASLSAINCNPKTQFNIVDSTGAATKTTTLINCSCENLASAGLPLLKVKNCSLTFTLTSLKLTSYGSTLNVYANGAIAITGTLFTSTITRKNTSTLTAVLNNSFDESLA